LRRLDGEKSAGQNLGKTMFASKRLDAGLDRQREVYIDSLYGNMEILR
jgi:hypothetical protein